MDDDTMILIGAVVVGGLAFGKLSEPLTHGVDGIASNLDNITGPVGTTITNVANTLPWIQQSITSAGSWFASWWD